MSNSNATIPGKNDVTGSEKKKNTIKLQTQSGNTLKFDSDSDSVTEGSLCDEDQSAANKEIWPPIYRTKNFTSGPILSRGSHLKRNMLKFVHSFGFECCRSDNLHLLDEDTLMYVSGNLVHFCSLSSSRVRYLRSSSGTGLGHATVHPSREYLAVAEKGQHPLAIVYTWPQLEVSRVLRNGTQQQYAYITFSDDGDTICTLGSEPDYMLTLWDWRMERVLLRSKAFSQDVYRVAFSSHVSGQLVSAGHLDTLSLHRHSEFFGFVADNPTHISRLLRHAMENGRAILNLHQQGDPHQQGLGHIRFWKMANTFTGLKLQGVLGRFGKTEISDIHGFIQLPDGKVVSGCDWGNLLLWEHGLIKVEVTRRDGKPCHSAPIYAIYLEEGELYSLGGDGWVRTWNYDALDQAEIGSEQGPGTGAGDARFVMEPMNELCVHRRAQLRSMVPATENVWALQDGSGAVWRADLSFSMTAPEPQIVFNCPASSVRSIAVCPTMTMFAVTAEDGCVCVYNYKSRELLARTIYPAGGSAIIWLPEKVCGSRLYMMAAFSDGCIRLLTIHKARNRQDRAELSLLHVLKPHAAAVTAMAITQHGRTLITAGADGTVWFFSLVLKAGNFIIVPLGFTDFANNKSQPPQHETVVNIEPVAKTERKFVLLTSIGRLIEMKLPSSSDIKDTGDSYHIDSLVTRTWTFHSVKSEILRDEARKKHQSEQEQQREQLRESIEQRQKQEIEVDVDSEWNRLEMRLRVEEEQWSDPPVFQPDPPSAALVAVVEATGHFYLLMDGYDAGWLYTASLSSSQQASARPKARRLPALSETTISVRRISPDKRFLALGLANGCVQVHQYNSHDPWRLDQYWRLAMHDNNHGRVTDIQFTTDACFMLSAGTDGNVFMYEISGVKSGERQVTAARPSLSEADTVTSVDDLDDPAAPCLQQLRETAAKTARLQLAEQRRSTARTQLRQLRKQYKQLVASNQLELPVCQQLSAHKLVSDQRVLAEQQRVVEDRVAAVTHQMAWTAERHHLAVQQIQDRYQRGIQHQHIKVHAFRSGLAVWTQRLHQLPNIDEDDTLEEDDFQLSPERIAQQSVSGRDSIAADTTADTATEEQRHVSETNERQLTKDLAPAVITALARMTARRERRALRQQEWQALMAAQPSGNQQDPGAQRQLEHALQTLGLLRLRSSEEYVGEESHQFTTAYKRRHVRRIQRQIYERCFQMNERVLALREHKRSVASRLQQWLSRAHHLQQRHLPADQHVRLPTVADLSERREEDGEREEDERLMVLDDATLSGYRSSAMQSLREDTGGGAVGVIAGESESALGGASSIGNVSTMRRRSVVASSARARKQILEKTDTGTSGSAFDLSPQADSSLLRQVRHYHQLRAISERDSLLRQIDELLRHFDSELAGVWQVMLDERCQLKQAELLLLTACRELALMEEFEQRERSLQFQLAERVNADSAAQTSHSELVRRQLTPQTEHDQLVRRIQQLSSEVAAALANSEKFASFLARVYRRKPPRLHTRARGRRASSSVYQQEGGTSTVSLQESQESDPDSDSSASSSSSDLSTNSSDSGQEPAETQRWDLNQCPAGCDPQLFEWVQTQRQNRWEAEHQLEQRRRQLDQLQHQLDASQLECNSTAEQLADARQQLRQHQLAKLGRLNQVPVTVTLLLHQTGQRVEGNDSTTPQQRDSTSTLLMPRAKLVSLSARVDQLFVEWRQERHLRRSSREQLRQLMVECSISEETAARLTRQCDEAMVAKFGRLVPLQQLETIAVNLTLEQMRCEVQRRVAALGVERRRRQHNLSTLRTELDSLTRDNTRHTNTVHTLRNQRQQLGVALDSTRAGGLSSLDWKQQQEEQLQRLAHTVTAQQVQIAELQRELYCLGVQSRLAVKDIRPTQPIALTSENSSDDEF